MLCKDRNGNYISNNDSRDRVIRALYESGAGRTLLKVLTKRPISVLGGMLLKTRVSSLLIDSFVRNNGINMDEYLDLPYDSYNDFFIRKIKKAARPIDQEKTHFISPADSKLYVSKIDANGSFRIKDSEYTFLSLTRSKKLAERYEGGYLMIFRLSVDDYHRYCYVDSGSKGRNYRIKGCFHTVNPIASDTVSVYKENQREFSILNSDSFGKILMMEVGAMMVGKIVNYHERAEVKRGMEKGRFEFGGSTVILAVEKDRVILDEDILQNSEKAIETKVRMGEKIGTTFISDNR
ncbi:MAG: phosphatidylserine decarboxylase [Bacillota bacterium]|nr:phosphatidylserine decarboxylase [Bacillota bacterium]